MTRILDRNELITSGHLEREAHIYIRQSTLTQVREHSESLERQYELVESSYDVVDTVEACNASDGGCQE